MTFTKYEERLLETLVISGDCNNTIYGVTGLCEEVGEVAGKLKRLMRGDISNDAYISGMKDELGDVLWYVAGVARALSADLNEVAILNLVKLQSRKNRGKIGGSGDTR